MGAVIMTVQTRQQGKQDKDTDLTKGSFTLLLESLCILTEPALFILKAKNVVLFMVIHIIKHWRMDWSSGMEMYCIGGREKPILYYCKLTFMSHLCDLTLVPVCVCLSVSGSMCLMKWDSANRRALTDANEQPMSMWWWCRRHVQVRSDGFTVAHEREGETVSHLTCITVSIYHVMFNKAISALLALGPLLAKWVS